MRFAWQSKRKTRIIESDLIIWILTPITNGRKKRKTFSIWGFRNIFGFHYKYSCSQVSLSEMWTVQTICSHTRKHKHVWTKIPSHNHTESITRKYQNNLKIEKKKKKVHTDKFTLCVKIDAPIPENIHTEHNTTRLASQYPSQPPPLGLIHTGRRTWRARKLEHKSFDVACVQYEHSCWQQQVPFACVALCLALRIPCEWGVTVKNETQSSTYTISLFAKLWTFGHNCLHENQQRCFSAI